MPYQSNVYYTDPAIAQGVDNLASAIFGNPAQQAQLEHTLSQAKSIQQQALFDRQNREFMGGAADAFQTGDYVRGITNMLRTGDANYMPYFGSTALAVRGNDPNATDDQIRRSYIGAGNEPTPTFASTAARADEARELDAALAMEKGIAVQEAANQGSLNVQYAQNRGNIDLQRVQNEGNLGVQRLRNTGSIDLQHVTNAGQRDLTDLEGALNLQLEALRLNNPRTMEGAISRDYTNGNLDMAPDAAARLFHSDPITHRIGYEAPDAETAGVWDGRRDNQYVHGMNAGGGGNNAPIMNTEDAYHAAERNNKVMGAIDTVLDAFLPTDAPLDPQDRLKLKDAALRAYDIEMQKFIRGQRTTTPSPDEAVNNALRALAPNGVETEGVGNPFIENRATLPAGGATPPLPPGKLGASSLFGGSYGVQPSPVQTMEQRAVSVRLPNGDIATPEDIMFTAEKHGVSMSQVIEMMKSKGGTVVPGG